MPAQQLDLAFDGEATLFPSTSTFQIKLAIHGSVATNPEPVFVVEGQAHFTYTSEDPRIPPLFIFPNAVGIFFPYLRAFLATISAQSQSGSLWLPLMNLTELAEQMRSNLKVVENE